MLLFALIYFISIVNSCTILDMNFDDVAISSSQLYVALPRPYDNFIFKRINTAVGNWSFDNIPATNVSTGTFAAYTATSPPNVIFTTGENLSITKSDNSGFKMLSVNMTSIYINNMGVNITGYRRNATMYSQSVSLLTSAPSYIAFVNWNNVDQVIIGCSIVSFSTCAHITYDDVVIC
jgi:hypothetical protein